MSGSSDDAPIVIRPGETATRPVLEIRPERTTTLQLARPRAVHVVELGPPLFRAGSAVPRLQAAATPRLVDALVAVLARLKARPDEPCLTAGHHPDAALSRARAAAVLALLRGDAEALGAACQARHTVEDWQELCKLAAQRHGWPCDPGAIDGKPGPRSKAALDELRRRTGAPPGGPTAAAGDWRALLGLVDPAVARRLRLDGAPALAPLRVGARWVEPAAVGCAESWPAARCRLRDHTPAGDERVDILVFEPGAAPKLACHAGDALEWKACDLYRKGKYRAVPLEARGGRGTVLELASAYFNTASAQFLPRLDPPAGEPPREGSTEERGLEVLVYTFRFLELYRDRALVVAGHADTAGSDAYNQPLSEARAGCVVALLEGDRAGFVAACKRYHRDEDDAYVLRYAARTRGWPCDPGDGGRATKAQVKAFQTSYNQTFGRAILEDGIAGQQTWGAYYDLYDDDLAALAGGPAALAEQRGRLRWVDPARKALGCGEEYPRVAAGVDGLAAQENRRIEVLFFEPSELPPEVSGPAIYGGGYTFEPLDLAAATYRADLRLVDHERQPLGGAAASLHGELDGGQVSGDRAADPDGRVLWERLPFARYAVHVEHDGRRFSSPISLRPVESQGGEPLEVVAPPRYRAHLRLVDASRAPLAQAKAQLFREDGAEATPEAPADAQGEVRFGDLPLDEYVVRVEHDDRAFSAFISLRQAQGEPLEVVAPPRYRAHLRLVDASRAPLAQAKAQLFREDGAEATPEATADAQGEVRFDDLPLDEYVVRVEHDGRAFSAFISLRQAQGEPLEVVAPPRYRAHLRLVDASRAPLAQAKAQLFREDGAEATKEAAADTQGEVRFDDLPLDEYVVRVDHDGRAFSAFISLRQAQGEPLEVVAPPRYRAHLRLVDAARAPLAQAKAQLFREDGAEATKEAVADGKGEVRFDDLPLDEYVVRVDHDGRAFSAFISLRQAQGEALEVVAPPRYRAHLRLVDAARAPLAQAKAQLFREDGAEATKEAAADGKGEVRFDDLPLDEYVVRVEHDGRAFSAFISLRQAAGEALEVVAPPRYRAHLRLVDAARAPLAQAKAQLFREDGAEATKEATADAKGEVRFDDLPLDEYVVLVNHGALRFSSPLSLRAAAGEPLEVVAPPRFPVAVRLLRPDQTPVGAAQARLFEEAGAPQGDLRATDANGDVRWDGMPPGEYVVEFVAGGASFSSPLPFVDRARQTPAIVVAPEIAP
ncbi:MAG: hypothetical protein KF878_27415 [Planctomycetes bacterium]|nr:hypothetical protein [Planctomycetota bacterium]